MSVKVIKMENKLRNNIVMESNNEVADEIKDIHDILVNAGFKRMSYNLFGTSVKPNDICYTKTSNNDDFEAIVTFEKGWFDGKDGYILQILGDEEEDILQNTRPLSINNCVKITKLAEKFFDEYPTTNKFMKKFADEYDLQYGY